MSSENVASTILISTLATLVLAIGFLIMFILFYRSRKKILLEKQKAELDYLKELANTKTEIQNQTLNHIGRELHDNVGQLLAVAKIHTNKLCKETPSDKLNEINTALTQSIDEVRAISHSLNADRINTFGLITAIQNETERIKKLQTVNISTDINTANQFEIESDREIMLYRIIQEFISNSLRYAQAKNLNIKLSYQQDKLLILMADDGIGFDSKLIKHGSGLTNMKHRAKLIRATFDYLTAPKNGTILNITLPKNSPDEKNSNSRRP